jgi:putative addiction module component (TIGR02574 family)
MDVSSVMADRDEPEDALSDSQKKEIDRRIAELDASPNNVLTWEEMKAKIQKRVIS